MGNMALNKVFWTKTKPRSNTKVKGGRTFKTDKFKTATTSQLDDAVMEREMMTAVFNSTTNGDQSDVNEKSC